MRLLDLFSGIGGISLAADWAGMQTVAFCEIEPYPQRVLRKHWPDVPIIPDVHDVTRKELTKRGVGAIDIVSIGDPCQPYSVAGKREGAEDDRYLWPQARRIVEEIRPRWVVRENVPGNITMGLDGVLDEMEALDYTAWPIVFPAAAVGASHKRDRVFVVAYSGHEQPQGRDAIKEGYEHSRRRQTRSEFASCSYIVGNADCIELQGKQFVRNGTMGRRDQAREHKGASDGIRQQGATQSVMGRGVDVLPAWLDGGLNPLDALAAFIAVYPQPALMGQPQHDWEPPRVATGVKHRAARLKALGNAVSPLQIYPIMAAIKYIDDMMR